MKPKAVMLVGIGLSAVTIAAFAFRLSRSDSFDMPPSDAQASGALIDSVPKEEEWPLDEPEIASVTAEPLFENLPAEPPQSGVPVEILTAVAPSAPPSTDAVELAKLREELAKAAADLAIARASREAAMIELAKLREELTAGRARAEADSVASREREQEMAALERRTFNFAP